MLDTEELFNEKASTDAESSPAVEEPIVDEEASDEEAGLVSDGAEMKAEDEEPEPETAGAEEEKLDVPADVVVPADDREIEAAKTEQPETEREQPAAQPAPTRRPAPKPEPVFDESSIGIKSVDLARKDEAELSPEEELNKTYRDLRRAARTEQIIWGTVMGADVLPNFNDVCVYVLYDNVSIIVPSTEFFEPTYSFGTDYDEMTEREKRTRRMVCSRFYFNARVPLRMIRTEINTDGDAPVLVAVASRKAAMAQLRDRYFINPARPQDAVAEGALAKAHVLTVRPDMATVECLGVETRILSQHLSNEIVENCHDFVSPGDNITVRIRKLHINEPEEEGGEKTVYLNVTGQINAAPAAIASMTKNSVWLGTVVAFNREKQVYTILLKNGVHASIPQKSVMGEIHLEIGDSVSVSVRQVYDNYVRGFAVKL